MKRISEVEFTGNACFGTLSYIANDVYIEVTGEFSIKNGILTHDHWFDEDGNDIVTITLDLLTLDLLTYDVVFNDDESSNSKGMASTIEDCREYILENNGTSWSYFGDYKGGTVSIVCNETGEVVETFYVE